MQALQIVLLAYRVLGVISHTRGKIVWKLSFVTFTAPEFVQLDTRSSVINQSPLPSKIRETFLYTD
jgi:hypothetical protein